MRERGRTCQGVGGGGVGNPFAHNYFFCLASISIINIYLTSPNRSKERKKEKKKKRSSEMVGTVSKEKVLLNTTIGSSRLQDIIIIKCGYYGKKKILFKKIKKNPALTLLLPPAPGLHACVDVCVSEG